MPDRTTQIGAIQRNRGEYRCRISVYLTLTCALCLENIPYSDIDTAVYYDIIKITHDEPLQAGSEAQGT